MTSAAVVVLVLTFVSPTAAQKPAAPSALETGATTATPTRRNPSTFRATQLLGLRQPGVAPRVRFEWEQVPGAPEYVLTGRWTDAQSWALRSQEYRVTARTATRWEGGRVTFDVSVPEGNHSWKLVAVFGLHDAGDFANAAHVSFDVR